MTGIEVREAGEDDLEAVLRLYDQLAGDRVEARPCDPAAARPVLHAIRADPDRALLVAVAEGSVVGTADLLVVANLTHGGRPWAIVENVVVDEAWRGRGAGRVLMAAVVDRARRRGCHRVQLLSRKERTGAHRFYEQIGFASSAKGFRRSLDDGG